jgi:hypothetical protein
MFSAKIVNHGGHYSDAMQSLAQWRHPVASSDSEARDVLHRAVRPASYRRIPMAIEIASDLPAFFVVLNFVFAHNHT